MLTIAPASVDVRASAKTITVTATASDASAPGQPVSGVSSIQVTVSCRAPDRARRSG